MSTKLTAFRIEEKQLNEITEMREQLNLDSNTDVVKKALLLLKAVNDNQKAGGSLLIKSPESAREVIMI